MKVNVKAWCKFIRLIIITLRVKSDPHLTHMLQLQEKSQFAQNCQIIFLPVVTVKLYHEHSILTS